MHAKKVWLLTDDKVGNSNQSRCLAKIMGWAAYDYTLKYSILGIFFNFIPFGLNRLSLKCKKELISNTPPDIIVTAGRRTAAIAVAIKSLHPKTLLVQIMSPELPLELFDAVILPQHDKKPSYFKHKNIIWTHDLH